MDKPAFLLPGPARSKTDFRCLACAKDVSCGHQGKRDVERHISVAGHKKAVKALQKQQFVDSDAADTTEVRLSPMLINFVCECFLVIVLILGSYMLEIDTLKIITAIK